jgi:hypothetical protein
MKIKAFILIAALWANIAISDNSKTNQFFEFFNSVESLKANRLEIEALRVEVTICTDLSYNSSVSPPCPPVPSCASADSL